MQYLWGKHGLQVGTVATATSIANSITEAHVMLRYLRPDLLEAAGVLDFDTWAATFGQTTARSRSAPTAARHAEGTIREVPPRPRAAADVVGLRRRQDRRGPQPAAAARAVHAPRGQQAGPADHHRSAVRGTDRVRRRAGRARVASAHPDGEARAGQHAADLEPRSRRGPGHAADRLLNGARRVEDRGRRTGPTQCPGGFQIVFCDLSTPKPDECRRRRPGSSTSPRNDLEKADLSQACRSGDVAVLIGSTGKRCRHQRPGPRERSASPGPVTRASSGAFDLQHHIS